VVVACVQSALALTPSLIATLLAMQITLSVNVLYIKRGALNILVDVGKGDVPLQGNPGGTLLNELKAMCVEPHDITHILLTHAHWDHIGGLFKPGTNFSERAFDGAKVGPVCA
jgi:glyoxylase-like metal-dependent hydrolase (beta-lactamase superfamily II)